MFAKHSLPKPNSPLLAALSLSQVQLSIQQDTDHKLSPNCKEVWDIHVLGFQSVLQRSSVGLEYKWQRCNLTTHHRKEVYPVTTVNVQCGLLGWLMRLQGTECWHLSEEEGQLCRTSSWSMAMLESRRLLWSGSDGQVSQKQPPDPRGVGCGAGSIVKHVPCKHGDWVEFQNPQKQPDIKAHTCNARDVKMGGEQVHPWRRLASQPSLFGNIPS